jgi:hypothetical protein
MQYFAANYKPQSHARKLLFYLVTRIFAEALSGFEAADFTLESRGTGVRGRTRPDVLWDAPTSAV